MLRFHRADGRQVPAVAEMVEVADDGAITGWRTVSTSGVGWFAGVLPDAELAAVRAVVSAIDGVAAPSGFPAPGAPTETLEIVEGSPVSVEHVGDAEPGPWPPLVATARRLLERLTDFPRAAVGLSMPTAKHARLEHLGTEALQLDLAAVTIRATAWRGYYVPAGDWSGVVAGPERVEAGPGWGHDVELGLEDVAAPDITVHVAVTFAIVTGDRSVPVQVSYAPPAPLPAE